MTDRHESMEEAMGFMSRFHTCPPPQNIHPQPRNTGMDLRKGTEWMDDLKGKPRRSEIETHMLYVMTVLRIFSEADYTDGGLIWRVEGERIKFSAMCSDTFQWGTADAEPIGETVYDLGLLQWCFDELRRSGPVGPAYLPELFAARKRGMRPMRLFLRNIKEPGALALLTESGPERDIASEG